MKFTGRVLLSALLLLSVPALADDISNGSYSTTDGGNNAAPPNGWPAGMFPNQVEPSARSNMGATKRWWERANAGISTTGTGSAYVLTPTNTSYPTAYTQGEVVCAKAHATNSGSATLNYNGKGAKGIYASNGIAVATVSASQILSGQQFCVAYDGALNTGAGGWQLMSPSMLSSPIFFGDVTAGQYLANGTSGRYRATGFGLQTDFGISGITGTDVGFGSQITVVSNTGGVALPQGGGAWVSISDETEKNILRPISGGLNKIASLRTVIGIYKADTTKTPHPFLIAQDVQKVLPEAVTVSNGKTLNLSKGKLLMSYTDVIPLLVSALKDQVQVNNELRRRVTTLEAKNKK